jgi:hypothetical protein
LLGELLEGKLHEQFLWGGTGNGPSRKVRHRASSSPDKARSTVKDFSRIATRYDKLARNYLASACLAAALVWWI